MIEVIESPLLRKAGFLHGFSLRSGGVSLPPFDTANLGRRLGDRAEHVAENHRRLAARIGYRVEALYECSQVHGRVVVEPASTELSVTEVRTLEADALISPRAGDALGVRTADCVPLLIGDVRSGAVAAVHAGWRGVGRRGRGGTEHGGQAAGRPDACVAGPARCAGGRAHR